MDNVLSPDSPQHTDLVEKTTKLLTRLQNFRRFYDPLWFKCYKQYIGSRDGRMFPDGVTPRSNTASMYPYSNVETIVAHVHDSFFSYEDWFEAKPRGGADGAAALAMDAVLKYKLRNAQLPQAFEAFVRNLCIYGHAAIKVDWDWGVDVITKPQAIPVIDPQTGQPAINPQDGSLLIRGIVPTTVPVPRARPRFSVIDPYDLLIDPEGLSIAHLAERTLGQILADAQANPKLYNPEGIQELVQKVTASEKDDPMGVLIRLAEVWDTPTNTCTTLTFSKDFKENLSWKDQRYASRTGANLSTYKRKIYSGPPVVLWAGENYFMHKRAPILVTSYVKLPNEIFGLGAVETIGGLTDGYDKFVNMITDNWNLNINKRYAYNTQSDIDHEALNNFNVPGGKVGVTGNPSEAIMPLPHFTPAPGDYEILPLYKNMIEMSSGISDFYSKGVGSGGGNDTATGISSVIGEANYRFKQLTRNLEMDILQPLLVMCCSMVQQFMTDQQEIEITDKPAGIKKLIWVSPEELIGAVDFDIVASQYVSNKIIRQRNIMALAQLLAESQWIDERVAIMEILKIFEIKNIDQLMKTPEQLQAEQQAQLQQQVQMMIFEAMLQAESGARLQQSKPITTKDAKTGRPRTTQPEGPIPGAGLTSAIRGMAQQITGRSMGLGDMGEIIPKK
jgi:hypothetical protein